MMDGTVALCWHMGLGTSGLGPAVPGAMQTPWRCSHCPGKVITESQVGFLLHLCSDPVRCQCLICDQKPPNTGLFFHCYYKSGSILLGFVPPILYSNTEDGKAPSFLSAWMLQRAGPIAGVGGAVGGTVRLGFASKTPNLLLLSSPEVSPRELRGGIRSACSL